MYIKIISPTSIDVSPLFFQLVIELFVIKESMLFETAPYFILFPLVTVRNLLVLAPKSIIIYFFAFMIAMSARNRDVERNIRYIRPMITGGKKWLVLYKSMSL